MTQTQSIIVYRSPAEAAFWESGMAWPLFFFLGVFLVCMLVTDKITRAWSKSRRQQNQFIWATASAIASFLLAGGITQMLFPIF